MASVATLSRLSRVSAALLLAALLSACATTGSYAEVTGERPGQADAQVESVSIIGIDRKLTFGAKPPHRVEPGFRMLLAESERKGRRSKLSEASIPLTARPCMRYHFVAKHESMTQVEPWEVELRLVEPIPECLAAFPQVAGKS